MKSLAFATLLLAACATATGDISLRADKSSPTQVQLTLTNNSTAAVMYNLCPSVLQRRDGASWTPVPTDEMCTMELRNLAPGESAAFTKTLPSGLPAGEYRYMTIVHKGETRVEVDSNPFSV